MESWCNIRARNFCYFFNPGASSEPRRGYNRPFPKIAWRLERWLQKKPSQRTRKRPQEKCRARKWCPLGVCPQLGKLPRKARRKRRLRGRAHANRAAWKRPLQRKQHGKKSPKGKSSAKRPRRRRRNARQELSQRRRARRRVRQQKGPLTRDVPAKSGQLRNNRPHGSEALVRLSFTCFPALCEDLTRTVPGAAKSI